MLTSTLPDLPGGQRYRVKGVACSATHVSSRGHTDFEGVLKELEQQATALEADAILDIKVTLSSEQALLIGTAVKITP